MANGMCGSSVNFSFLVAILSGEQSVDVLKSSSSLMIDYWSDEG